jgi:hypothetical protein
MISLSAKGVVLLWSALLILALNIASLDWRSVEEVILAV